MIDTSSPQQRLALYKEALFVYRLCRIFPAMKYILQTQHGLCHFFSEWFEQRVYMSELPELKKLKPVDCGFWDVQGKLKPRIKWLKQAIKDTQAWIISKKDSNLLEQSTS